jgi:hypothetical protein
VGGITGQCDVRHKKFGEGKHAWESLRSGGVCHGQISRRTAFLSRGEELEISFDFHRLKEHRTAKSENRYQEKPEQEEQSIDQNACESFLDVSAFGYSHHKQHNDSKERYRGKEQNCKAWNAFSYPQRSRKEDGIVECQDPTCCYRHSHKLKKACSLSPTLCGHSSYASGFMQCNSAGSGSLLGSKLPYSIPPVFKVRRLSATSSF